MATSAPEGKKRLHLVNYCVSSNAKLAIISYSIKFHVFLIMYMIGINPLSASSFKCLMLGDGGGRGCEVAASISTIPSHWQYVRKIFYILHLIVSIMCHVFAF